MVGATTNPENISGYLVSDLIGLSLRQIGIGAMGTTASDSDISDGVMHLNMMLAQWQRKRWMVPCLIDLSFPVNESKSVFYIGPGGDLDIPSRPDKLNACYCRLMNGNSYATNGEFNNSQFSDEFNNASDGLESGNPLDFPLTSLGSYEDYSSIGLKGLRAFPSFYFYNPAFTLGELRITPIPSGANWEVHILCKSILPNNLKATDTINLPSEYADAIMWMLAVRMAPSYGQEASQTVSVMAKSCMDLIRTANVQIPRLGMPPELNSGNNPFYWPGLQYTKL